MSLLPLDCCYLWFISVLVSTTNPIKPAQITKSGQVTQQLLGLTQCCYEPKTVLKKNVCGQGVGVGGGSSVTREIAL